MSKTDKNKEQENIKLALAFKNGAVSKELAEEIAKTNGLNVVFDTDAEKKIELDLVKKINLEHNINLTIKDYEFIDNFCITHGVVKGRGHQRLLWKLIDLYKKDMVGVGGCPKSTSPQ